MVDRHHDDRGHRGGVSIDVGVIFGTAAGEVVIRGRERDRDRNLPVYVPGYPQRGPVPIFNGASGVYDNRNFGPYMTQQGVDAVTDLGPDRVLPIMRKGFTERRLPDGEHVGVAFNFDQYGQPAFGKAFDLNNPAQLNEWETMKNNFAFLEARNSQGPGFRR